MAREAKIRNQCVALIKENKGKSMEEICEILAVRFEWTLGNAKNAYRWNVRKGTDGLNEIDFPIVTTRGKTAETPKPASEEAKAALAGSFTEVAKAAQDELTNDDLYVEEGIDPAVIEAAKSEGDRKEA